jgi:hypothetical protein
LALAALLFLRAINTGRLWIGFGRAGHWRRFPRKFTNGVQLGASRFSDLVQEHRRFDQPPDRGPGCGLLIGISPILVWNIQTGWVHAMARVAQRGEGLVRSAPGEFLEYIGAQFGVISPLIMAGIVVAAIALLIKRRSEFQTRFLLSHFLPVAPCSPSSL